MPKVIWQHGQPKCGSQAGFERSKWLEAANPLYVDKLLCTKCKAVLPQGEGLRVKCDCGLVTQQIGNALYQWRPYKREWEYAA